jgi:hypothetical protein
MHILPANGAKRQALDESRANEDCSMMTIIVLRRLMREPVLALLGTLACAIAAKSGTLTVSLAFLGAAVTFTLTRALAAYVANIRGYE